MIAADQLIRALGLRSDIAAMWSPHLTRSAARWQINTPARIAAWIAQCSHESAGYTRTIENLNYAADALPRTFGAKRFPAELAQKIGRVGLRAADQRAIAIAAYGGRMGNLPAPSSDGWDYRGRGLIQVTGRDNYEAYSRAASVDCLRRPDMLLDPEYAADSAGWFWASHGCNQIAEEGDFEALTRRINGGLNGYEQRLVEWQGCREVWR